MTSNTSSTTAGLPKLLHLGCGLTTPTEWVNVDGSFNAWLAQKPTLKKVVRALHLVPRSQTDIAWPTNVVIADLRKRLPFRDGEFDAVYSSHFLEHITRAEALAVLKEGFRVLRSGGRCRSLVPDLNDIVMDYVERKRVESGSSPSPDAPATAKEEDSRNDPARRMLGRMLMRDEAQPHYGFLYGIYRSRTDFHPHKWMYDHQSLKQLMEEAGFRQCEPKQCHETTIPFIDKVEKPDRCVSGAIIEGVKP